MKFVIERTAMLAAMTRVDSIVRNPATILSHVLIEAMGNGVISFRSTSLDIESITAQEGMVQAPGIITTPSSMLLQIVRNMPEGAEILCELTANPPRLNMKAGRSKFNLATLPATDFPTFNEDQWAASFDMPAPDLCDLLLRGRIGASKAKLTPHLTGVYLNALGDEVHAVSMNGYQSAFLKKKRPADWKEDIGVIVPPDMGNEILALLSAEKGDVRVQLSQNKIRVIFGHSILTAKLLAGPYMDYVGIIARFPAEPPCTVQMGREQLIDAVKRVTVISDTKGRGFKLAISDGVVHITSREGLDEGADLIECEMSGEPCTVGFNAVYALPVLEGLKGDTVQIDCPADGMGCRFSSPDDPGVTMFVGQRRV